MIEEYALGPRLLVVTVLARRSLCSFMRVVFLMAVATKCWRLGIEYGFDVTRRALNVGVRATERVLCIDIVIKRDLYPFVSDMASVAVLSKVPIVIVVVLMAGETGCGQLVGKWIITVAVVARQHRVFAGQTERGVARVVE